MTTVECLRFPQEPQRAREWFDRLALVAPTANVRMNSRSAYQGDADWLMLWGPGAPDRQGAMQAQRAAGRHVLAWDGAYWSRDVKLRVSLDDAHPVAWVMRTRWPDTRLVADQPVVSDQWRRPGPVIIAGLGVKARVQYGAAVIDAWEAEMIAACRMRWPDRPVIYRRKRSDGRFPRGVTVAPDGPIESILAGASLVITWHSNVAVDAIRCGLPVVCRDGAAAAVCPSELPADPQPLAPAVRDRFLQNLAWFQWRADEAAACWAWLRQVLA